MGTHPLIICPVSASPRRPAVFTLALSVLSSLSQVERIEIPEKSEAGLFTWTLTHFTPAFSEVRPIFRSRRKLEDNLQREDSRDAQSEIIQIATSKINSEWRAWMTAHEEFPFDEYRLDNMLMRVIYPFILKRDGLKCTLCQAPKDLTIHHIIQKKRHIVAAPPFGRSVPTNLITLCRRCHAFFDPAILN